MNKILRISMIAVLALIANVSFAGVSTIDFTKLSVKTVSDVNNKENNGYTFTSGDFTFTAKKNNGQTAPTQNTKSKELRHYAKNSITISGAKMTKMVFTMSEAGKKQWATVTASEGTMTVDKTNGTTTWENTNGSSSVTLTVGDKNDFGTNKNKTAGQFNVDKVDITSDGQGGGETPTPPAEETKAENIAAFKALASGTTATLTLKNAQVVYKNVYRHQEPYRFTPPESTLTPNRDIKKVFCRNRRPYYFLRLAGTKSCKGKRNYLLMNFLPFLITRPLALLATF